MSSRHDNSQFAWCAAQRTIVKHRVGSIKLVVLPMQPIYNEYLYEWITPVIQYRGNYKTTDEMWLTYYTTREVQGLKDADGTITIDEMLDMYKKTRPLLDGRGHGIWPIIAHACDRGILPPYPPPQ